MTIQVSLRRRARAARLWAMFWLFLAVAPLMASIFFIPVTTSSVIEEILITKTSWQLSSDKSDLQVIVIATLVALLTAAFGASYFLARAAMAETIQASRLSSIADALCISGNSIENLKIAVDLFVPVTTVGELKNLPLKEIKELLETIKKIKA